MDCNEKVFQSSSQCNLQNDELIATFDNFLINSICSRDYLGGPLSQRVLIIIILCVINYFQIAQPFFYIQYQFYINLSCNIIS